MTAPTALPDGLRERLAAEHETAEDRLRRARADWHDALYGGTVDGRSIEGTTAVAFAAVRSGTVAAQRQLEAERAEAIRHPMPSGVLHDWHGPCPLLIVGMPGRHRATVLVN